MSVIKYPYVIANIKDKELWGWDGASSDLITSEFIDLGNVDNVLNNLTATSAPTVSDDTGDGYSAGSVWINTSNNKVYFCSDASAGAANWILVGSTGVDHGTLSGLTDDDHPQYKNACVYVANSASTNVKGTTAMADYVCDGTSDEVEIQQAIDAVAAVGGGIVHILPGTYTIGVATIKLKDNVILEGQGKATVITIPDGSAIPDGFELGLIQNYDRDNGNDNVVVRNLAIDCNYVGGCDNVGGIDLVKCDNALIEGVEVYGYTYVGLYLDTCNYLRVFGNVLHDGTTAVMQIQSSSYGVIAHNIVYSSTGIVLLSCSSLNIENNNFSSTTGSIVLADTNSTTINGNVSNNAQNSIYLLGTSSNNIISNNSSYNDYRAVWIDGTAKFNNVVGNSVYNSYYHGIDVGSNSTYNIVSGNIAIASGQYEDVSNDCISICGDYHFISGNMCKRGDGAKQPRYGISLESGTTGVVVTGNDVRLGGKIGEINNAGTANIISGNVTSSVVGVVEDPVLWVTDGVTAPTTAAGYAGIYVDTADGDLKVKFGDGTVTVIAADS